MNRIKSFFRELFKIIRDALWGYTLGILIITLTLTALNEVLKMFIELGFFQFAIIATGLILILGIVDYWKNWGIFEEISDFIEKYL